VGGNQFQLTNDEREAKKIVVVTPNALRGYDIQWTDRLKYLGITVRSGKKCEIDISVSLQKAYSAANSIWSKTKYVSEIVMFYELCFSDSFLCARGCNFVTVTAKTICYLCK